MVSIGIDEPLKETEYGAVNPYRTGLGDFLAQAESDEREEEAAQAHDAEDDENELLAEIEANEGLNAIGDEKETDSPIKEEEFKFTIGADDDDDEDEDGLDEGERDEASPEKDKDEIEVA